ncbi:Uncharacterised protein [uncultured Roseburia sp.]|uniref:DUF4352 domain-containing protein n=1 Tax=Brotonthovivens ammoniilytica TaxID=2981725 RepID=A0ABT2THL8_9FIRM|nr:hypothetical protein [Brotonthovivens ammoniilytica]MCU6761689.1 hypothetical protein [Brotonthovivens ammoniilytica]SCI43604.1 Uncharacterised protein [uncultured Roseburia sp.]
MSERRYESDMTKKEKRQMRKEQLKSMKGKERLDYIWTYYKLEMGMILFFVIIGVLVVNWLLGFRYDQILYVGVVNSMQCDGEQMAADYKTFIGNDDKFDEVDVDTSMEIDPSGNTSDFYGEFRFSVYNSAPVLDAVIVDQEVFEVYDDSGLFMNLEDFFTEDTEEYQDLITNNTGLNLKGSKTLQSYGVDSTQPVYLMVSRQTENVEYVKDYIRFLLQ